MNVQESSLNNPLPGEVTEIKEYRTDWSDTKVATEVDGHQVVLEELGKIQPSNTERRKHCISAGHSNVQINPKSKNLTTATDLYQPDIDDDDGDQEEEDESEDEGGKPNIIFTKLLIWQDTVNKTWVKSKSDIQKFLLLVLVCGFLCYFGYAMYHERLEHEQSIRLCWVTCVVVFFILLHCFLKQYGPCVNQLLRPVLKKASQNENRMSWMVIGFVHLSIFIFTIIDVLVITKNFYNLVSGGGVLIYVLLMFMFSKYPAKVKWRPVVWGLGLQSMLALCVLRWQTGYDIFAWLGDRVEELLSYTQAGCRFVFGDNYEDHFFVFAILPITCFFSALMSIMYYLGVTQVVVVKMASFMRFCLKTTAGESLSSTGNIFLSMTEGPLMIRPLLSTMTRSEIHAVMAGGFATMSGSILAAYVMMGVSASHLLTASVMSAPAALAISKLFYPETKKSKQKARDVMNMPKSTAHNLFEAASEGASTSIGVIANVVVNLIAFISLLEFINTTLSWFGDRIGVEGVTLQFLFSYIMFPFVLIMGVNLNDCRKVGVMTGIKIFLNEFLAYEELGQVIRNKEVWRDHVASNGSWEWRGEDIILSDWTQGPSSNQSLILKNGIISDRSEAIATYALCGFANFGSIAIQIGCLGALVPRKKSVLVQVVFRAFIAGIVADFLTACIAGLYFQGEDLIIYGQPFVSAA